MRHRKHGGRHLGRHRAPTAPRSRYAVVVTSAVVGAGVVALGTGAAMPDNKPSPDTSALHDIDPASASTGGQAAGTGVVDGADSEDALAERQELADRASRSGNTQTVPDGSHQEAPEIWVLPCKDYDFSSGYGYRALDGFHGGADFAGPLGTPIHAASDGVVTFAGWGDGYGKLVKIDHGNGLVTYYGHNSDLTVSVGDHVRAGDQIAKMGSTGYSTGSHLHYEVRVGGERVDPVEYMRGHGVDIPNHVDSPYI